MEFPNHSAALATHPTHPKLTFTGKELNELLHISSVTRWRLEKRGLLMPVPGLRHKLYSIKEVEAFLARKAIVR